MMIPTVTVNTKGLDATRSKFLHNYYYWLHQAVLYALRANDPLNSTADRIIYKDYAQEFLDNANLNLAELQKTVPSWEARITYGDTVEVTI